MKKINKGAFIVANNMGAILWPVGRFGIVSADDDDWNPRSSSQVDP